MIPSMLQPRHPLLRAIGVRVRYLRQERGLSQESLADLADIDRSYMSAIERGLRNLSVLNIARIAGALNVGVRDLLDPQETVQPWTAALQSEGTNRSLFVLPPSTTALPDEQSLQWKPGRYLSLG
jgi:transcriptional regulator with XRE-family HTH domain